MKTKSKKAKIWIGMSRTLKDFVERGRNALDEDVRNNRFHPICCRQFDGRWKFNSRILEKYGLVYNDSPDLQEILTREGWE
jgi:hypothetical protein